MSRDPVAMLKARPRLTSLSAPVVWATPPWTPLLRQLGFTTIYSPSGSALPEEPV